MAKLAKSSTFDRGNVPGRKYNSRIKAGPV
jgi:hypothetical protein